MERVNNNRGINSPFERFQDDGSQGNDSPSSSSGWGPIIPMFGDGPVQIYNIIQLNQINQNQFLFFGGNPPTQTGSNSNALPPPSGNLNTPQNSPFTSNTPNTNGINTGSNFITMPPTGQVPVNGMGTGQPSVSGQDDAISQQLTSVCIMLIQFIQKMVMSFIEQRNAESANSANETECVDCAEEPDNDSSTERSRRSRRTDGPEEDDEDDTSVPGNLREIDRKYGDIVEEAVRDANRKHPGAHITKNYVLATIMRESSGNPNAEGDGGTSLGLMQINDAHGLSRADRFDPETSIRFATNLMAGYSAKYRGDVRQTAMAYMTGDDANGPYGDMAREYAESIVSLMNGG
jgi:Transglycosylase SLT domain